MAEIQRLRRKFILVGTLAVIIIVVGALGLINTISYMRMQHSVFSLLTSISENGGQLPRREGERPSSWIEDPDWYALLPLVKVRRSKLSGASSNHRGIGESFARTGQVTAIW